MRTISRLSLFFFIMNAFAIPEAFGGKCQCYCDVYNGPGQNVCDRLQKLDFISLTNSRKLMEWQELKPFVEYFSSSWREEIADIVEEKIDEYITAGKLHPKPEALVRLEDEMQDDSAMNSNSSKDGTDVVSNLLAKVEMVENRTSEVEEELKSERRVRRHLQQEVNKTQSSLISLSDQLQNVTVPVDARMNQVENVLISTLDNMNRTIFENEDHLKKLYYKVDGVVYQNETKKLDERLEHVETELLGSDNSSIVSKIEENFKTVEKSLYFLKSSVEEIVPRVESINDLAGDILIPRIATLENETVRKNDTGELEIKIASLLKDTELMRFELTTVSLHIQDIQNLKTLFENLSVQWDASLRMLQNQIESLKNESFPGPAVKQNGNEANEIFQQNNVDDLPEDNEIPNPEDYEDFEMISSSLTDASRPPEDDDSMSQVGNSTQRLEISPEVNETNVREVSTTNYEEYLTLDPEITQTENGTTVVEFYTAELEEGTSTASTVGSEEGFGEFHEELSKCGKPVIVDDHLLADVVNISHERDQLKFGCRPIGLYKISYPPVPPRCEEGSWRGPFPNCTELADISTVDDDKLHTFIPPIFIEPDNIDRPGSHLGTGSTGQLIVHPRSSFTLHCLYPDDDQGDPKWNVTYVSYVKTRSNLNTIKGKNKVSVRVTAATEEDSGIYTCVTPFEVEHAVEVIVKAVVCPAFSLAEEYEDVYYRPTPEGEFRIIGTRAELQCEEGHRIFRQCLATGTWSNSGLPSEKECTLKKRNTWNCKTPDVSEHPDLILERSQTEKKILFKCAGGRKLIGYSYMRCKDDGHWTQTSLPRCK